MNRDRVEVTGLDRLDPAVNPARDATPSGAWPPVGESRPRNWSCATR